jgi:hypothetical protein
MEEDKIIIAYPEGKIINVPVGFTEVKYVKARLCWLKHVADLYWIISVEFKDKYPYSEGYQQYMVKMEGGKMIFLFCSLYGDISENMIKVLREEDELQISGS